MNSATPVLVESDVREVTPALRPGRLVTHFGCALAAAMSVTVLIGWSFGLGSLVRLTQGDGPMPWVLAVSGLLSASGITAASKGWRRWTVR